MREGSRWLIASTLALVAVSYLTRGGDAATVAPELRRHVEFLAADELAGRETGAAGIAEAERYIASAFADFGLRPLPGRESFFVPFTLHARDYDRDATGLDVEVAGRRFSGTAGVDFRPFEFSAEGRVEGRVIFAGYGITAPELDYDDYAGLDVEDQIVLVLRHEPGEVDPASSFDGTRASRHAQFAVKAERAREHGARGMILVTDPLHHPPADDLRLGGRLRLGSDTTDDEPQSPVQDALLAVHAGRELVRELLEPSGLDLATMQRAIDAGTPPAEFDIGAVRARIRVRRAAEPRAVEARNVAGLLPGSDPELRDEWVVIGAHHDHVGGFSGEGDTVFNGADDNASGTSAVLALARMFAGAEHRPRRSLLFVTFSAEEKGLLGSRALVEQALIPLERVVFMLNLDMIGRNPEEPLEVFGDGHGRGLRRIVENANRSAGVELDFAGTGYFGNSDHHWFYRQDIPFLFFFSGVHEDYHQLADHPDKLDYSRMERIVRLAREVIREIAGADRLPAFVHNVGWLGLAVEMHDGLAQVARVERGSRAAKAGLRVGDRLEAIGGRRVDDDGSIGGRFRDVAPGTELTLTVKRGAKSRELSVLRAKTGFMGIGSGRVSEELREANGLASGEGVLVRNVVEGGPSDRAGIRAGDVLLSLAGQPVDSSGLGARLSQIGAGETVDVVVLRDGKRKSVSVTLGERPRPRGP